jgi:hypothetical protein
LFLLPLPLDDKNPSNLSFDAIDKGHSTDFDPISSKTDDTNMTATPVSESEAFHKRHSTRN